MQAAADTSTGLSPRTAATLAYSAWWLSGLLFWYLERHDRFVRFHAAQAVAAFGLAAVLIGAFGGLAILSLSFLPNAFALFAGAAAVVWLVGIVVWLAAMWHAASGSPFRIPIAADWADRLID